MYISSLTLASGNDNIVIIIKIKRKLDQFELIEFLLRFSVIILSNGERF